MRDYPSIAPDQFWTLTDAPGEGPGAMTIADDSHPFYLQVMSPMIRIQEMMKCFRSTH